MWTFVKGAGFSSPLPGWRSGDLPGALAWFKTYSSGTFAPFTLHFQDALNAPFTANWNDFPGEDLTLFFPALWVGIFGLSIGINFYMLFLHIACGLSFFYVARTLKYSTEWCVIGGFIFAFSPLLFFRGIAHLTVATVWHLPFIFLALIWLWTPEKTDLTPRQGWNISLVTCVLAGILNPYYACIFVFLLAIAWLSQIFSGNRNSQRTAILIWIVLFVGILVHLNYFIFRSMEGVNPEAVGRALSTLASVSLTLSDLILSPAHHPIWPGQAFPLGEWYFSNIPDFMRSESQLSYIGLIPALGLALLFSKSTLLIFKKQADKVSEWFWFALGIFAFSITGGINYLLGAFGFLMLRSNNRFSVFLLLIGLFYLCEILSRKQFNPKSYLFAAFVICFTLWDQVPSSQSQIAYLQETGLPHIVATQKSMAVLEERLSKGAMVFQLPVHAFPEAGEVHAMGDYDLFLPYLYSNNLRFSYGSMKGREDSAWQARVAKLPINQMAQRLEAYGFSAILINRDAYPDEAVGIIKELTALGYQQLTSEENLIAFALHPNSNPISPAPEWEILYGGDFSKPEVGEKYISHWIKGNQVIIEVKRPWYIKRTSGLEALSSKTLILNMLADANCNVSISRDGKEQQSVEIISGKESQLKLSPSLESATQFLIKTNCQSNSGSLRILEPLIR